MGIQMVGYKMIYKNVIYNLISMAFFNVWNQETNSSQLKELEVVYIDENNRLAIIKDKVEEFQIMSK